MKARSTHAGPPVRTSSPLLKRCLRSGSGRRGGGSLGRIGGNSGGHLASEDARLCFQRSRPDSRRRASRRRSRPGFQRAAPLARRAAPYAGVCKKTALIAAVFAGLAATHCGAMASALVLTTGTCRQPWCEAPWGSPGLLHIARQCVDADKLLGGVAKRYCWWTGTGGCPVGSCRRLAQLSPGASTVHARSRPRQPVAAPGEAGHRRRLGHIITVSLSPCTVVVMVADAQLQRRRHVSYQHVKSAPAVVVARWQCLDTVCGVGVEHTQQ